MDGHAGYAFPWGGEISVRRYTCATANNQSFFCIDVEHGENPTDATYAYVIIPYAGAEKLDTYVKNPDVEILSNTKAVQAVFEKGLNIKCYAFHEAANVKDVSADAPCLVTLTGNTVAVSDPTHELEKLTVTVAAELNVTEMAANMSVAVKDGMTVITLDLNGANGRKFELKYEDA